MTHRIFITGTDTDIGKTFISALLLKKWNCDYWKPIQTGLNCDPGDTATVQTLLKQAGGGHEGQYFQPAHEYQRPLSPWSCTVLENKPPIDINAIEVPNSSNKVLIIEGAGGVLVPIGPDTFTTDLIEKCDAKVILVARSGLGTINHTLLTLEVLKARNIEVLGVVLNGDMNRDNRLALEGLGVSILAEIPRVNTLNDAIDLVPSIESLKL